MCSVIYRSLGNLRHLLILSILLFILTIASTPIIAHPTAQKSPSQDDFTLWFPSILASGNGEQNQNPDRLLATGQTMGYYGNEGVPQDGNRDDGDLIKGRASSYEYSATYPATTQAENLVIDHNTGLMWIRDITLLDSDDSQGVHGNIQLNESYSWQTAIERSQTLLYAGYDDWRLPNLKEQQSLINYGRSQPAIQTDAFPTAWTAYPSSYHWTSTTYPTEPDQAFYVNFLNGHTYPFAKATRLGLRPVRFIGTDDPIALLRTGQTIGYQGDDGAEGAGNGDDGELQVGLPQSYSYEDDSLIDSSAENVTTDQNTNLMWVRDPSLLTGDGGADSLSGNVALNQPADWQTMIERVNQLAYAGYNDWRMPNIVELESLTQAGRGGNRLDPMLFPNIPTDPDDPEAIIWWSSTTSAFDRDEARPGRNAAWFAVSTIGSTNHESIFNPAKSRPGYLRPVRDVVSDSQNPLYRSEVRASSDFAAITLASPRVDLLREGKFIVSLDKENAPFNAAYQDVNQQPLHYEFLINAFPTQFAGLTAAEYIAMASQRASRAYYAGGLKSFTDATGRIVYGFDIYTDPANERELLTAQETALLYQRLVQTFHRRPLLYSPSRQAAIALANSWTEPGFPIGFPEATASPDYEAYTKGQSYGVVRLMSLNELAEAAESGQLSRQEIIILDSVPTDLEGIVAGVVTGDLQGELSHLSIRMARRGTPNGYVKDSHAQFAAYAGQLVRLSMTRSGYYIETDISQAEAEAWWASQSPPTVTVRAVDPGYTKVDGFDTMGANDEGGLATTRFGGKAANLARLYRFLPSENQVSGFAIPFHFYLEFLESNTLIDQRGDLLVERSYADYIRLLHEDPLFRTNSVVRATLLKELRDEMDDNGDISAALVTALMTRIEEIFGQEIKVRFRSSSNAEDGIEFNGAGLYDSTSVCLQDNLDDDSSGPSHCDPSKSKERTIERGLRRVWSSLWNFRAWEEREYYGIDHLNSGMAILVTTAFPDERANGVAFTGDPAVPDGTDYLINVQLGDTSVVLPDSGIVPERDQLTVVDGQVTEISRIRASTLITSGAWVMSDNELRELGQLMALADEQFPVDAGSHERADILLDLEFKIQREDNGLIIKQIRPFLKSTPLTGGQASALRVHVPETASLCNRWQEGFTLRQELDNQMIVELLAGDIAILFESPASTHSRFGLLQFGPAATNYAALSQGQIQIQPTQDEKIYTVHLDRSYGNGTRTITVAMAFDNIHNDEFDIRWLDEATLTQQLFVTGIMQNNADGSSSSPMQLTPCNNQQHPLIQFDITLEDGQSVTLQQRRERDDGITGHAALVSAVVNLSVGSRAIDGYGQLIYTADRHHWNEQFWVLFDTPIGDAYGIGIYQSFTGSGTPTYRAELLDASFNQLRPLVIESVVHNVINEE